MPQSLSAVYLHLVFSTTGQKPLLTDPPLRHRLHHFIGGVTRRLECPSLRIGGAESHVHVLARFSRKITQAEWVKEIKRVSSLWLKEQSPLFREFHWQNGYAVFSVSSSRLEDVRTYIDTQIAVHRKTSFQQELTALLDAHGLEYDEKFLWD